jgi:pilus assembly protein Flp/PilA
LHHGPVHDYVARRDGAMCKEKAMTKFVRRFLQDQSGATAIEYAGIAGFLSIVFVTVVAGLGSTLKDMFTSVLPAFN